jgi:hypothetical protein
VAGEGKSTSDRDNIVERVQLMLPPLGRYPPSQQEGDHQWNPATFTHNSTHAMIMAHQLQGAFLGGVGPLLSPGCAPNRIRRQHGTLDAAGGVQLLRMCGVGRGGVHGEERGHWDSVCLVDWPPGAALQQQRLCEIAQAAVRDVRHPAGRARTGSPTTIHLHTPWVLLSPNTWKDASTGQEGCAW